MIIIIMLRVYKHVKKWIDENDFPVRPLTPARKAKLEKEKRGENTRKK